MRIKLIINPEAGIQKNTISRIKQNLLLEKKNKTIDTITTFFKERGHKLSVSKTKEPGDATKISKMAKDYDVIIAAGGDGTINEVINGAGKKARIGIIPTGSENVLAKEIKIQHREIEKYTNPLSRSQKKR